MIDQLAKDYGSKPVVFLEQQYYHPTGDRRDIFLAAVGGKPYGFPEIMVDSGHQVFEGPPADHNYYSKYKQMVDDELARKPKAAIQATSYRIGSRLRFQVWVQNLSGVALSAGNQAKVHVIVYENTKVYLTSRFVRAEADASFPSALADQAATSVTIDTADLTGVNWGRLSAVALVDYQPGSGAYDLLNAAQVKIGRGLYLPCVLR